MTTYLLSFSITGRGITFVKNTGRGVVWVEKRWSKPKLINSFGLTGHIRNKFGLCGALQIPFYFTFSKKELTAVHFEEAFLMFCQP